MESLNNHRVCCQSSTLEEIHRRKGTENHTLLSRICPEMFIRSSNWLCIQQYMNYKVVHSQLLLEHDLIFLILISNECHFNYWERNQIFILVQADNKNHLKPKIWNYIYNHYNYDMPAWESKIVSHLNSRLCAFIGISYSISIHYLLISNYYHLVSFKLV